MTDNGPILGPSRRRTWLSYKPTPPVIDKFIRYDYKFNHYNLIAERGRELCIAWIENNKKNGESIEASVTCRAKEKPSLLQKLVMRNDEKILNGEPGYESTQQIQSEIVDLAGVRIILYMPSETQQERVKEMIQEIFGKEVEPKVHSGSQRKAAGPQAEDEHKQLRDSKSYRPTHLGYTAVHYRVAMKATHRSERYRPEEDDRVSKPFLSIASHRFSCVWRRL
jgi:ppGpp synthetase/RelA/SpoT-type nucleotidyltranferase